jgi:mRNA interferase MazF
MRLPIRGELWWVDLGMAGKVRPVAVVSAEIEPDDYALIAAVPHTTSLHSLKFAIRLRAAGLKEGMFNVQGLTPVPLSKFVRRIGSLSAQQMQELDQAIKCWLCLE